MTERRATPTPAPLALLLLASLLGACGNDPGRPAWTRLATLFRPEAVQRVAAEPLVTPAGRPLAVEEAPGEGWGAWLGLELARSDWVLQTPPSLWRAHAGLEPSGRPATGEPARLLEGARELRHQPRSAIQPLKPLEEGSFQLADGDVLLRVAPGEEPPASLRLLVYAGRGGRGGRGGAPDAAGGTGAARPWRVRGERFSGDALPLWPGERWEAEVPLPAGSALRLATVVEPLLVRRGVRGGMLGADDGDGPPPGEVRFRVLLDGREVLSCAMPAGPEPQALRHVVPLGEAARPAARLAFEVAGTPAATCFLAPVVGPAQPGTFDARPWGRGRPDLVLFLADTFRADNLALYGGSDGVTPHLDALAREALVLRRAWSVGTYTLPAHASLFSGVFPRQAGILGTSRALPEDLLTIAELLAASGYRTGAVTDSVIVSSRFGMDQGFEWFEEQVDHSVEALERTNERVRAFLDADDGRPVFLFVQSYRAHLPYRVSPESLAAHGARLGIEGELGAWKAELEELDRDPRPGPRQRERRAAVARALRAHYLGGVADVDRGFEDLRRELEGRGLLDAGVLVFTSDHGEAFGEHGRVYHTGPVWEEESRIPLLFVGRGIEPGVREEPVSLVDLPPTLARLAGVEAPAAWLGRSLLAPDPGRTVFVFECKRSERSTLAIVEGERKVIGYEDPGRLARGELFAAFDLAADPREQRDLARSGAEWPRALLEGRAAAAAVLLEPIVGPQAADLDEAKLQELRAVGYGGD